MVGVRDAGFHVAPDADVLERLGETIEDDLGGRHVLHVPAVDRPHSRVEVQIRGDSVACGLVRLARIVRSHICLRAEQPFFFATPQRDANRAAGPRADSLQDAHRFHHRRRPVGIVGRAGARVPGIQVRAEQNDFILQHRIGSRDLGNYVVALGVRCQEASLRLHAQLDRNTLVDHARDHVVVLGREHDRWLGIRSTVAAEHECGAVFAGARSQDGPCARVTQDLRDLLGGRTTLRALARHRWSADPDRRVAGGGLQPVFPYERGHQWLREDDCAAQGALHGGDVRQ